MKMSQHILVGVAGSLPVFWISRSFQTTIAFFLSNSLIDLDHLFDYWYDHGFNLSWGRFNNACQKAALTHYIVILHSFEVLFLVFILGYFLFRNTLYDAYWGGICLGLFCHLLCDAVYNKGMSLKYYFIFFRFRKGFKMDDMADPMRLRRKREGRA